MLGQGEIVLVRDLLDPNGVNPKTRPCVVVTRAEDLEAGAPIVVVAITTLLPGPQPPDTVLMPYHPQGRGRTGLRTRCAAVPSWIEVVDPDRIDRTIGHGPPAQFAAIAEILHRFEEEDRARGEHG
jgi:mRNA-degrading endonuclease toxin of MazEF toxin-antitoxin module